MPTPKYTALATLTLTGTDSSITFGSIPSGYRDLLLVVAGTTNESRGTETGLRLNSDSSSNYAQVKMAGSGSSAYSNAGSGTYATVAIHVAPNLFQTIIQVMDYSATDKHKTILARSGNPSSDGTMAVANRWGNTAAVTSLTLVNYWGEAFKSGTTFDLYGVK